MLVLGQQLGQYRILRRLGGGGLGEVWSAQGVGDATRQVAVKILHSQYTNHPEASARFAREAKATQALSHPSIVCVFDYVQLANGPAFIVMEDIPGCDLRSFLSSCPGGVMRPLQAVRAFQQIGDALAYAHQKGIIHRDLKLGNVMVVATSQQTNAESPQVKVLDFGIAKAIGPDFTEIGTSDQAVLGTYEYMAPEQIRDSSAVTEKSDVYSMGIMLHCCLGGALPFRAEQHLDGNARLLFFHQAHTQQEPPSLPATVPAALRRLVSSMLTKDPADRPIMTQCVAQLADIERSLSPHDAVTKLATEADQPTRLLSMQAAPDICNRPSTSEKRPWLWMALAGLGLLWALVTTALLVSR